MAKVVDLASEAEQTQDLAVWYRSQLQLKEDDEWVVDITQTLEKGDLLPVLQKLADKHDSVFSTFPEKDIEGFFYALWSLLRKLDPSGFSAAKLVSSVASNTEEKPLLRIKILSNIYDLLSSPAAKYELFMTIAKYASDSHYPVVILPQIKHLDRLIKEWGIDKRKTQDLYQLLRTVLLGNRKSGKAFKFLLKYIRSIEEGGGTVSAQDAATAVTEAIKSPKVFEAEDLLNSPSVAALQTDADTNRQKLYQLLSLFVREQLGAYTSFAQQNPDFFKAVGLSHEETLRKMRLLSLTTLASQHQELSYGLVAETLQINQEEVESWVINTIAAKLIDAKLDQMRHTIVVSRAMQRVFPRAQWEQLGSHLTAWKENIKTLLQVIQSAKTLNAQ